MNINKMQYADLFWFLIQMNQLWKDSFETAEDVWACTRLLDDSKELLLILLVGW